MSVTMLSTQQHTSLVIDSKHMRHVAKSASVWFGFQSTVIIQYPSEQQADIVITDGQTAFFLYFINKCYGIHVAELSELLPFLFPPFSIPIYCEA